MLWDLKIKQFSQSLFVLARKHRINGSFFMFFLQGHIFLCFLLKNAAAEQTVSMLTFCNSFSCCAAYATPRRIFVA